MKPIPKTEKEMRDEARQLGLLDNMKAGDSFSQLPPRGKLLTYVYNSWSAGRSFNRTFMMVLGVSGAGKSSCINHLLGLQFAKTSETESETKSTTEFLVSAEDPHLDVSDLTLGIIDTPGWNDTEGPGQDACNLMSIKKFCNTSQSLKGCKPNIILLVIQATDTRFSGKNSRFAMALRAIGTLGVVDKQRSNVVIVMTWVCGLPHANVQKWKEKVQAKSIQIKELVRDTLGVNASVVYMENAIEDNGLDQTADGQQSNLPDGTEQPKNLFHAIAKTLAANNDELGRMTFARFFELSLEGKRQCIEGLNVDAKNAKKETLSSEESKIMNDLQRANIEGSQLPEVQTKINVFLDTKNADIDEVNRNEAQQMCTDLVEQLGLLTIKEIQEHSVASICSLLNKKDMSPFCKSMLTELFGIKLQQTTPTAFTSVGTGYNILNDEMKPFAMFKMDEGATSESDIGLRLPKGVSVSTMRKPQSFIMHFDREDDYIKYRLRQLNVNAEVDCKLFAMKRRSGFSRGSAAEHSFLFENRVFNVKIEDMGALVLMETFRNKVISLPLSYNSSSADNRAEFEQFFNAYGHFVIAQAYGGGSIEVICQNMPGCDPSSSVFETRSELEKSFRDITGGFSEGSTSTLSNSNLAWTGGNSTHHTSSLSTFTSDGWKKWDTSLGAQPALLTTEMTLIPISEVVRLVDPKKEAGCAKALNEFIGGQFTAYKKLEKEKADAALEEARKEESNRQKIAEIERRNVEEQARPKGGCFPGSSRVRIRNNNTPKLMSELCIGDEVLSFNGGKMVYSPVYMFATVDFAIPTPFLEIYADNGSCITLTPKHMIQVNNTGEVKFADQIIIGDSVFQTGEQQDCELTQVKVVRIVCVTKNGYYAPLTLNGTIVVDDILASCYTRVPNLGPISSQTLAHLGVSPLRAAYYLGMSHLLKIPDGSDRPAVLDGILHIFKPFLSY